MTCGAPMCLNCEYYEGRPKHPGGSGHCALVGVIPEKIYWKGGNCDLYKLSHNIEPLEGIIELCQKGSAYWESLLELGRDAELLNDKEMSLLVIFAKEIETMRIRTGRQARTIRLIEKRLNDSGIFAEENNEVQRSRIPILLSKIHRCRDKCSDC